MELYAHNALTQLIVVTNVALAVVKSAQQRSAHLEFNAVTFDSYGNCKLCKVTSFISYHGPESYEFKLVLKLFTLADRYHIIDGARS